MSSEDEDSFQFEEEEDEPLKIGVVGSVSTRSGYIAITVAKPGGGMEDMEIDPDILDSSESMKEVNESQESGKSDEESGSQNSHKAADDPQNSHKAAGEEGASQAQESLLDRRESSKLDRSSQESDSDSQQPSLETLLKMQGVLSPPTRKHKRKRRKARRPKQTREELLSNLPVLNKDTENKQTYDIEYLLWWQKLVKAKHRFVTKSETPKPEHGIEASSKDYIRIHIAETHKAKALPVRSASLSLDHLPAVSKVHHSSDFVQRLYQYRDQVEEKLKQTKERLMERERLACTFTPVLTTPKSSRERRQPEDLYYEGKAKMQASMRERAFKRTESRHETSSFRPELNTKSLQILVKKGRDSLPVYTKLYESSKTATARSIQTLSPTAPLPTFRPTINKQSQQITRDKQVNLKLYEDATRRAQKQIPKLEPFQQRLMSKNSEKVLVAKFEGEFETVCKRIGAEKLISEANQIERILEIMHFKPKSGLEKPVKQIWTALQGQERGGIKLFDLLTFLKAMMRFSPGLRIVPESSPGAIFGHFHDDYYVFSQKDLQRVHTSFESLYEARLSVVNKSNIHPEYRSLDAFPFKPDLGKTSHTPRSQSRHESVSSIQTVERRLLAETQRLRDQLEKAKEIKDRETMAECTFSPAIRKNTIHARQRSHSNAGQSPASVKTAKRELSGSDRNLALYRLAETVRIRRQDLTKQNDEIEQVRHSVDCPFSPSLDLAGAKYKDNGGKKAEGFDELVGRLRKAREERQRMKDLMERGEPSDYLPGSDFHHDIERTFKGAPKRTRQPRIVILPERVIRRSTSTSLLTPKSSHSATSSNPISPHGQLTAAEMMRKLQAIPQNEIMSVTVTVAPNHTEDLTLYEGDDLTSVVSSFAQKHGLKQEDMFKLRSLISAQLLAKDY